MPSSRTLFNRFKKRLRPKGRQWRGLLAAVDGNIEVPGRPYHYYVRLERSGGRGEPGIFPGTLVRPLENLPVLIEEDPRDGRQVIVDVDWATLAYAGDTDIPDPRLSRHRETHEFGGDDMLVWLSQRQIYELRVQPGAAAGHVSVLPGAYVLAGALYVNAAAIDVDLTAHQPATGRVWVLLYIDSDKLVGVSASAASPEALDDAPAGSIALGAVRLQAAATTITWDDILPLRTGGERRYTDEEAVDAVANALNNTTTISWYYDDPAGDIEGDVILKSGGSLDSDASGIYGKIASNSEINTGTDSEKIVTPSGLRYDIPATPAASRGVRLDSSGNAILPGKIDFSSAISARFKRSTYDILGIYQSQPVAGYKGVHVYNETLTKYILNIVESGEIGINKSDPDSQLDVNQSDTTKGEAVLTLRQADDSEDLIDFVASVGTGKSIDTAAVGSTYARLRIALNGTFYYLQAYNA